jgi:biotin carboxyl carrier protein
VKPVGDGVYRVEVDGRVETVYVAGPPHDRWVFWNGHIFRGDFRESGPSRRRAERSSGSQTLTAPMPATVVTIHVKPGDRVAKGQVVMLLEAMKMELPLRAPGDGVVTAIHCREGQLVQADMPLAELQ